jgi:hypothetical protein
MRFEFRVPDLLYKDTTKITSVNTLTQKNLNYFGEIINILLLTKSQSIGEYFTNLFPDLYKANTLQSGAS